MINKTFITSLSIALLLAIAPDAQGFSFNWKGKQESPVSKEAEALYSKAKMAYGSADYAKAISLCTKAIKADGKHAKAFALRGKARKDTGDTDKATKDLNRAITLDPKLGEAYYIRAQVHEIMGEMDKATESYKKGCAAGHSASCN